jgi:hypothetical protein
MMCIIFIGVGGNVTHHMAPESNTPYDIAYTNDYATH